MDGRKEFRRSARASARDVVARAPMRAGMLWRTMGAPGSRRSTALGVHAETRGARWLAGERVRNGGSSGMHIDDDGWGALMARVRVTTVHADVDVLPFTCCMSTGATSSL